MLIARRCRCRGPPGMPHSSKSSLPCHGDEVAMVYTHRTWHAGATAAGSDDSSPEELEATPQGPRALALESRAFSPGCGLGQGKARAWPPRTRAPRKAPSCPFRSRRPLLQNQVPAIAHGFSFRRVSGCRIHLGVASQSLSSSFSSQLPRLATGRVAVSNLNGYSHRMFC